MVNLDCLILSWVLDALINDRDGPIEHKENEGAQHQADAKLTPILYVQKMVYGFRI